jgi:GTP:adenosylcobinamide-phosphate guanylyltransferase
MDAIITAGGIPQKNEPLFCYTQGKPKALLPIAGKPMIQWVLDAVNGCSFIERVVIIGLPKDTPLECRHQTIFIESNKDMLTNIQTGAKALNRQDDPQARAFILASDVPFITVDMLDWLHDQTKAVPGDIFYSVIEKSVMEKRFPEANRTYVSLADYLVCGGDVSVFRLSIVDAERPIWKHLIAARKNPIKQARIIGLGILIPLMNKKLTLADAERKISRRLHVNGHVCVCPFAEMGMDVDKPHQFDILTAEMEQA